MELIVDDYLYDMVNKKSYTVKRVVDFHGQKIGQKLIIESNELSFGIDFSDEKEILHYVNEYIRLSGYAIDAFNKHIGELNGYWDSLHEDEYPMEPGTQLYNDYGHYILDFCSRICIKLNELQGETADWIFYGRMIGGEPILAAMFRSDPSITIHLEYYDPETSE